MTEWSIGRLAADDDGVVVYYKESAKRGWEEHKRRENEAMTVKAADKQRSVDDRNFVAITFDLQAVAYYTLLTQKKDRFTTKGSWQLTTLQ